MTAFCVNRTSHGPSQQMEHILGIFYILYFSSVLVVFCLHMVIAKSYLNDKESKSSCNCPADPPCSCDSTCSDIYCNYANLTQVPPFRRSNLTWYLTLGGNLIESISNSSFANLTLQMLILFDNRIVKIEENAFEGSSKTMIVLDLHGNKLQTIPKAVVDLQRLQSLDIHGNPIASTEMNELTSLSDSLNSLSIGSLEMTTWPTHIIRELVKLNTLNLYQLTMLSLPDDALGGLEKNMVIFGMTGCKIDLIPTFLEKLVSLNMVSFVDDRNVHQTSFKENTMKNKKHLTEIYISNTSIQLINRNIIRDMPSLFHMDIRSNKQLSQIANNTFSKEFKNLQIITLAQNAFQNFPQPLANIPNLTRLDLTNNSITEIRSSLYDFTNMTSLNILYLTGNPITTVSDRAFEHNTNLQYLYLDNTRLNSVPKAVSNIKQLVSVDLFHCPIECTCTYFKWIKYWADRPDYLQILGDCSNIRKNIMTYIFQDVPHC